MGDSVVVVTATVPSGLSDKFGDYGGRFVPEALMHALDQLAVEFERAREDPEFRRELDSLLADYVGRPSPLTSADRFVAECGGATVLLKREDLNHTGSHKINKKTNGVNVNN